MSQTDTSNSEPNDSTHLDSAIAGIKQYQRKLLSHCDISNANLTVFRHHTFNYVSGKAATFTDVDFSYSIFNECYFHDAIFNNCKFTGARFVRSNFRGAKFNNCDFRYIDAIETRIPTDEILNCLPDYPNIAREITQVMRRNANSLGDIGSARKFVICEIEQRKEHLRRAIRAQGPYYSKKYGDFPTKLKLIFNLLLLKFDSFAWGHGERIEKMIISVGVLLFIASGMQSILWWLENTSSTMPQILQHFLYCFVYYVSFFLSLQQEVVNPQIIWIEWLLAILRLLAFGMLVASLFRWLSRR